MKKLLMILATLLLVASLAACSALQDICPHVWGALTQDDYNHAKTCKLCGLTETEVHSFDDGSCGTCGRAFTYDVIEGQEGGYRTVCIYNIDEMLYRELVYTPDGVLSGRYDYYFDNEKRMVRYEYYDSDGELDNYQVYTFNSEGDLIKYAYYYGDGELANYSTYEYDKAENKETQRYFSGDGTPDGHRLQWRDENGYVVKEEYYDADGALASVHSAEYNAQGNAVKIEEYDGEGALLYGEYTEYYDDGAIKKITMIDADGETWIYEYDTDGNIVKETVLYADGEKTETEYDSDGVVREIFTEADGSYYVKQYNKDGCAVIETYYNADGSFKKMIGCDENGKEIKREESFEDGSIAYIERAYNESDIEISYYQRYVDGNGIWSASQRKEYYDNGNLKKEILCTANGTGDFVAEYDENGNKTTHYLAVDDGDCTTERLCKCCSAVMIEAKEHHFAGQWLPDAENGHYHACTNEGCTAESAREPHTEEDGVCTACGAGNV